MSVNPNTEKFIVLYGNFASVAYYRQVGFIHSKLFLSPIHQQYFVKFGDIMWSGLKYSTIVVILPFVFQ